MARAGPAPAAAATIKTAVTAAAIASDGMRYAGRGYVFGGNASTPGDWDCSSFVSYVLGHDLGMALPGGRWGQPGFPPSSHGPVVFPDYTNWAGAVPVQEPQAGAGDLVLWAGVGAGGHMGIVLGPGKMVSALNPQLGTLVSPITGYGPLGVNPVYRRITAASPGGTVTAQATGGGGPSMLLPLLAGGLIAAGMTLAVLGLAVVVSAGAAALAGAAARKVTS